MIIGISGKMYSGKDLAGIYIQHILKKPPHTLEEWESEPEAYREYASEWEIKKFGGPLKDVVCILLGCSREDLEDRNFKDKILGREWWTCRLKYSNNRKFIPLEEYERMDENEKMYVELHKPTVRDLLQRMGTEAGREQIHPNIWVNALMKDYTSITKREFHDDKWVREDNIIYPNWIITDVRFPTEVEAIEKRGGVVIRINREVERDNHPSETMLDDYKFDYVVENNGTKEELYRSLVDIYTKLVNDKVVV